jgi:hypothetical protein
LICGPIFNLGKFSAWEGDHVPALLSHSSCTNCRKRGQGPLPKLKIDQRLKFPQTLEVN